MQLLSLIEARAVLISNGVPTAVIESREWAAGFEHVSSNTLPLQSGKQLAFWRNFVIRLDCPTAVLAWITDWPLYEPDEMSLIQALRGFPEESLLDMPVHFISKETLATEFISLAFLISAYDWEAYFYLIEQKQMFCCSNGRIYTLSNRRDDRQFVDSLEQLLSSSTL